LTTDEGRLKKRHEIIEEIDIKLYSNQVVEEGKSLRKNGNQGPNSLFVAKIAKQLAKLVTLFLNTLAYLPLGKMK